MRQEMDVLSYVSIVYSFSALFLVITSVLSGISFTGYRSSSYVFMALLAIAPQLIGHTSINWALRHLKASVIAIIILGEPIGASILAYLIFQERISSFQGIGIILILVAIIIASRSARRQR